MSSLPSEKDMQEAPIELEVSVRLDGEMVRCKGYISQRNWNNLDGHDAQYQEVRASLAQAVGAVLSQIEVSQMLPLPARDSCPDPAQSPE